jgi:adenylate cyclase class IV
MARVEYKIREVNREWLEGILINAGAVRKLDKEIFTSYYDIKGDEQFIKTGKRLSVSDGGDTGFISFKDKYSEKGEGISDELVVEVSDPLLMDKILSELGYTPYKTFKKKRIEFHHGPTVITFDKYLGEFEYIPEFMIIESDTEEHVAEWIEQMGYHKEDAEIITVLNLIKYYKGLADSVLSSTKA